MSSLATGILDDIPQVFEISNNQQKLVLDKVRIILEEVHVLGQSTQQQSFSSKWHTSQHPALVMCC